MIRLLFLLPPFLLLAMSPQDGVAPDKPIPPEAAAMANPVRPTQEGLAKAKTMYGLDCALCHGATGDGKGDLVADLKLTMQDWTASPSVLNQMKDGELFYLIKNGKGKMPPEAGRVKDDGLWNMVVYVRSLAKK